MEKWVNPENIASATTDTHLEDKNGCGKDFFF